MSIGHRLEDWELADTSLYDLYHELGANDTPWLFDQPFKLDTEHDWPAAGGMSTDRRTLYIDRTLYAQVMDGEFKASGLEPEQLIYGWIRHERIENAIIAGDNPVDLYLPSHYRALAAEHEIYQSFGVDPAQVEEVIWPAIRACYLRPPKKPPLDAWCGVYTDDAGSEEEAILDRLVKLDVIDARKRSKYETSYGVRGRRCDGCRNRDEKVFARQGPIFGCAIVSGTVRDNRGCDFWMPEDMVSPGLEDRGDKLSQTTVDYTDRGHKPELCGACMHWQGDATCAIVRGPIAAGGWCRLYHR